MKQRIKKKRNKSAPAASLGRQGGSPVSAPPVGTSASGRPCDDELTLLAEKMKPAHLKFCELYVSGVMGTQATLGAGFKDRKTGWALLRRADVRRYIELMQREVSVASRVSLNTLVDRLWRMATDPTIAQKRQDAAMLQLVRIFTAGNLSSKPTVDAPKDGAGLSDDLVSKLEAQLLGIRQPGPDA